MDVDRYFMDDNAASVGIVGTSPAIKTLLLNLKKVAKSNCNPVLITGETGTGKEKAANAVHQWRYGNDACFVAINCAALTASLLESELFGHEKGSFTGATERKEGLFEIADNGTVFLDEISEMPIELQAKLLRVIQERTYRRVGGTKELKINATIIASTNLDLKSEVKEGRFRKDLYYRLAVFPVKIPPLRDPKRRADITLLADYFIGHTDISDDLHIVGMDIDAEAKLMTNSWNGNVRELKNIIDRAMLFEQTDIISIDSLVFDSDDELDGEYPYDPIVPEDLSLETAEREFIKRALQETGGQRTRAAGLLGITRATLHSKLRRYEIELPEEDKPSLTKDKANTDKSVRKAG